MISTQPPKIIDDSSPSPSTSSTSTIFQQAIQNSSAYHRICAERRLEQPDPTHVAALSNLTHLTDLHANNLFNPDNETSGFDLVPIHSKNRYVNNVLSNSFGFGGTNASLLIGNAG